MKKSTNSILSDETTIEAIAPNRGYALFLPLKKKWFEMTKAGIKTEDYREITPYWFKRFVKNIFFQGHSYTTAELSDTVINCCCSNLALGAEYKIYFKKITITTLTLGYPKSGDSERIIRFEHTGIEIRTGKSEWGAEPDKLYFVIKHGSFLE